MTSRPIRIGSRLVGDGQPCFIVAEIGINHNGSVELAKRLIDGVIAAGCDAVKFQKRNPLVSVPLEQRGILRETPWGIMTYLEYRQRLEFDVTTFEEIDAYCREAGCPWFASCWDVDSVDAIEPFAPPCYKVASATLTNHLLLRRLSATKKPIILSTGMSSMEEIRDAVACFDRQQLAILHSTSTYPCPPAELNLRMIDTLRKEFACVVGYSGHEVGLSTTWAAVALGASIVERHITLDRAMWGTDQAASVELGGLKRLVENIRDIEAAVGDGVKHVYESELRARARLRQIV